MFICISWNVYAYITLAYETQKFNAALQEVCMDSYLQPINLIDPYDLYFSKMYRYMLPSAVRPTGICGVVFLSKFGVFLPFRSHSMSLLQ